MNGFIPKWVANRKVFASESEIIVSRPLQLMPRSAARLPRPAVCLSSQEPNRPIVYYMLVCRSETIWEFRRIIVK